LIDTDSVTQAVHEVQEFVSYNLLNKHSGLLVGNPDYLHVSSNNIITLEQIRSMREFLYSTSIVSGKKIVVIEDADRMNINAANACLKIFEEYSANIYIFLITNNIWRIIPTVLSRCTKIKHKYNSYPHLEGHNFISILLNTCTALDRIKFINKFNSSEEINLWNQFCQYLHQLIGKLCKKVVGINLDLTAEENELLNQFHSKSYSYLQQQYNKITTIINDHYNFDLDIRVTCILLIEQFSS
jgi:DNA polymerase-3 subunit delta'